MDEENYQLTDEGMVTLADWIGVLVTNEYRYDGTPPSIWQGAGYLVANDYSDLGLDATAMMLAIGAKVWEKIYNEFDEVQPNT